jgi:hypothetical protein
MTRKTGTRTEPNPRSDAQPAVKQQAVSTRWKPGQSGNPLGRPVGVRNKFSEEFVTDFMADWQEHGNSVLERVRKEDPSAYLRVAAVLVPKEMNVAVEQRSGPMDSEAMRKLRRCVDVIPPGVEEDAFFDALDLFMRSHFAKPVS